MMWYAPIEIAETEATLSLGQTGALFVLIMCCFYLLSEF